MPLTFNQLRDLPSPFYRVAAKALVFDDQQRVLMTFAKDGNPELPGGGWEHDETFEECLRREIDEELGVGLRSVSPMLFTYSGQGSHGWHALRLVARAELDSLQFVPGDDMSGARFVTKEELLRFNYIDPADAAIRNYVDQIWPQ